MAELELRNLNRLGTDINQPGEGGGGGMVVVTAYAGNTWTASHNYSEVKSLIDSGELVVVWNDGLYTYQYLTGYDHDENGSLDFVSMTMTSINSDPVLTMIRFHSDNTIESIQKQLAVH